MTIALPELNQLLDYIAARVAAKLRTQPEDYDSRQNLPVGVSARTFRARCKRIAAAKCEGKIWRCSREAWHASFEQPTPDNGHAIDAYEAACRRGAR